jgi:hypothetical protein
VAGAAVVAILDPHKTLGIDAATFGMSALIVLIRVRARPAPGREGAVRPFSVVRISRRYPDRLRQPYAAFRLAGGLLHSPVRPGCAVCALASRKTLTVGLLMAAIPLGMVIGPSCSAGPPAPSARIRMMGRLAVLSCAPLIGSACSPPLWVVLLLWTLAGADGACQLAAAAAFV